MTTTKNTKTPKQIIATLEVISEHIRLDLLMLNAGEYTLEEYTKRLGTWMRVLADNTGADRGQWEYDL